MWQIEEFRSTHHKENRLSKDAKNQQISF